MRNEDEALRALWDAYAEEATLGHNNVYEKARFEQMSVAGVFKLQQMVMSSLGTLAMHYPLATATNMKQAIRWVKNGIFYIINYNPESTTCEYWGGTGKTDPEFKRKISELEKIAIRMVEKREEKRRRERSLAVIENRMIYSYYERSTLSSYERGSTTITTSSSSSSSSSSLSSSSSSSSSTACRRGPAFRQNAEGGSLRCCAPRRSSRASPGVRRSAGRATTDAKLDETAAG